ncbi:DUF3710 domain-containing protein, partial [Pseudonocardia lacus]|uniref:DUF3710 domain-containing protein n=1 Tax=Pseudonocardia lacus TaxID=2835865 RepID=UPI001BDC8AA8
MARPQRTGTFPAGGVAVEARPRPTGTRPAQIAGPYDSEAEDEPTLSGAADFGSLRLPLPTGGTLTTDPASTGGPMQAVHLALPEGRLSVSALAAPKTGKLWPDLAKEIDASLRESGARVRSFTGEWGRELHATTGAATSLFLGADGPRWMVYGVATGPTATAPALADELRRLLRGTVVVRGRSPYPVRTVLPLTVPEGIELDAGAASAAKKPAARKPVKTRGADIAGVAGGARPAAAPDAGPVGKGLVEKGLVEKGGADLPDTGSTGAKSAGVSRTGATPVTDSAAIAARRRDDSGPVSGPVSPAAPPAVRTPGTPTEAGPHTDGEPLVARSGVLPR